jgi:hypothetical protein
MRMNESTVKTRSAKPRFLEFALPETDPSTFCDGNLVSGYGLIPGLSRRAM